MKAKTCEERIDNALADRMQDFRKGELEGLCFDYVEPFTFVEQPRGYHRWQLSWGGPSDEFRLYADGTVHYHFMDWYDGAKRYITDNELVSHMLNMKTFP